MSILDCCDSVGALLVLKEMLTSSVFCVVLVAFWGTDEFNILPNVRETRMPPLLLNVSALDLSCSLTTFAALLLHAFLTQQQETVFHCSFDFGIMLFGYVRFEVSDGIVSFCECSFRLKCGRRLQGTCLCISHVRFKVLYTSGTKHTHSSSIN